MGRRLALLLAILGTLASCKKQRADPPIRWHSLEEGEATARREHRAMLVFFHASYSVADRMLERETFPADDVRHELRDFVAASVDITDDEDQTLDPVKKRFRVLGVPTIVVLDADGKEVLHLNEFVEHEELARRLHEARTGRKTVR